GPEDAAATNGGRICGAAAVTGPPAPAASQYPAANSGAEAATAKPPSAAIVGQLTPARRPPSGPSAKTAPSAPGPAARRRPAAAMAVAMPGQALAVTTPGAVTRTRLATSAVTSPVSATAHPVYTRGIRRRTSSAQNAGRTSPAVTQAGGSPGPPGLS